MIWDKKLELADLAASITATAASTNVIGFAGTTQKVPKARPTNCAIVSKLAGTGAGTVTFTLQTATDEAFTSPVTIGSLAAVVGTAFVKGQRLNIPLSDNLLKYVRLYATISGTISIRYAAGLTHEI